MPFYPNRKSNNLASSISVFAIAIGLVVGQSASDKSLAQYANSPAPDEVFSINGAGTTAANTLFVGTGQNQPDPFGSTSSWFNFFGVGNPPSLNLGSLSSLDSPGTFRYASVATDVGIRAFFSQTPPSVLANTPFFNNLTILPPVSFAATDEPLAGIAVGLPVTGAPHKGKPIQVPVIAVGITLAFNRTGLNVPAAGLKLSRNTYLGILNGTITNWNAPQIRADNGGAIIAANLPIKFVRRSDDSSSTFVLSNHLKAAFGASWVRGVGDKSIAQAGAIPNPLPPNTVVWPASFLSASGDGGVASLITSTPGAIGYVDNPTRLARSLPAAVLQNKAGAYVNPSTNGIQKALASATIHKYGTQPDNRLIEIRNLGDPTPPDAYPIPTVIYMLFYDEYKGAAIPTYIRDFINWALGGIPFTNPNADAIATDRGYAPLPNNIKAVSMIVVNTCVNAVTNPSPCS